MKCYKCGKEMEDKNGANYIGASIGLDIEKNVECDKDFIRKQWGKWYDAGLKTICICWECYLDGMIGYKGDKKCQQ